MDFQKMSICLTSIWLYSKAFIGGCPSTHVTYSSTQLHLLLDVFLFVSVSLDTRALRRASGSSIHLLHIPFLRINVGISLSSAPLPPPSPFRPRNRLALHARLPTSVGKSSPSLQHHVSASVEIIAVVINRVFVATVGLDRLSVGVFIVPWFSGRAGLLSHPSSACSAVAGESLGWFARWHCPIGLQLF